MLNRRNTQNDLTNLGLDAILCKMEIIRREIGLENHRQHDSTRRIEFVCATSKPFPNSVSSSKRTRLSFSIDSSLSICHSCKKCKTSNDEKKYQSQHRQRKFSHQSKPAVPALHPPSYYQPPSQRRQQVVAWKRKNRKRRSKKLNTGVTLSTMIYLPWKWEGPYTVEIIDGLVSLSLLYSCVVLRSIPVRYLLSCLNIHMTNPTQRSALFLTSRIPMKLEEWQILVAFWKHPVLYCGWNWRLDAALSVQASFSCFCFILCAEILLFSKGFLDPRRPI